MNVTEEYFGRKREGFQRTIKPCLRMYEKES